MKLEATPSCLPKTAVRNVLLGGTWLVSGGAITTLLGLLQVTATARMLGVQDYGLFVLIVAAGTLVFQFVDFRTWEVGTRLLSESLVAGNIPEARGLIIALWAFDLVVGAGSLAITAGLSQPLANLVLQRSDLASLVALYAFAIPAMVVAGGSASGVLRTFECFRIMAIKSVAMAVARLVVTIGTLLAGYGLAGLVMMTVLLEVGNAAVTTYLAFKVTQSRIARAGSMGINATVRHFSTLPQLLAQAWLGGTIKGIQTRADVPLLGMLASPTAVGYYRYSLELASTLSKISLPVQTTLLPVITRLQAEGHTRQIRSVVGGTTAVMAGVLVPLMVAAIFFAEGLVTSLAGPTYAGAAVPLAVLVWGLAINTIFNWARPALVAMNRLASANWIALGTGVLELALLMSLVPRWEATGAAVSTAIMYGLAGTLGALVVLGANSREIKLAQSGD